VEEIAIGIAEDNSYYKNILCDILKREGYRIVLIASDGLELLQKLVLIQPEIVLMDIRMPRMNGVDTTKEIMQQYPHLKIIALTEYTTDENVIAMYSLGVKGFVGKSDPTELLQAINVVHFSQGAYISPSIFPVLQRHLHPPAKLDISLTDSERKLASMILQGYSSKEIGEKLNRSHRTVEDMRERLYQKLKVDNKMQMIALLTRSGLLEDL